MTELKKYIGDGVYIDFDSSQIILTTSNGIRTTNEIILDAEVLHAMVQFVEQIGYKAPKVEEYEKRAGGSLFHVDLDPQLIPFLETAKETNPQYAEAIDRWLTDVRKQS